MKKLSISLVSFILLSIVALGWGLDNLFDRYISDDSQNIVSTYQTLGLQLSNSLNYSSEPEIFVQNWQAEQPANTLGLLTRGELPLPEQLWQQLFAGEQLILESEKGLTLHFWLANHNKVLTFQPSELTTEAKTPWAELTLTSAFYIGIWLLLLLWLFPLVNSLRHLQKNARAYGNGDFSPRIKRKRMTYINDIESTFNNMADQIETLINDNKLISSAVSHDLRTPLARLRFGIDMLADTDNASAREKYQTHLSNDIDEMQALVEALLQYARLEQRMIHLEKEPVDLPAIINEFVGTAKATGNTKVELDIDKNTPTVLGHPTYLKMLIHNIGNNAIAYGQGKIHIEVTEHHKAIRIRIHDNGPGIPESVREDLFKPFVRGELKENHKGYGIGLAIAERICHWHGGRIKILESQTLGGAMFDIVLPN